MSDVPRTVAVARGYVEAMNAADIDRMMALFADDAVMRHMTGVYAGTEAIRAFFQEIAFGNSARLHAVELLAQDDIAWLEAEAESDVTPGRQRVVDVFRVNGRGQVADLGVYSGNIVPGSDTQGRA